MKTVRSPRQIIVGEGSRCGIAQLCSELGNRVLIVTDTAVRQQPKVSIILNDIENAVDDVAIYDDITSDVPVDDIMAALDAAKAVNADVVVAIGGGTAIDLGKSVGLLQRYGGTPADYYGEGQVPGPILPIIAVPTTSGTGSEVTPVAVLSDPSGELKVGISSVYLVPEYAVIDPELTVSCPPVVTAHSGVDALCHCVEAYTARIRPRRWASVIGGVSVGRNSASDEFALRGIRLIAPHLEHAVVHGRDTHSRSQMAVGAMYGGLAFGHSGTAGAHALQYPLGAATKTPHGLGVGLLLPYTLAAAKDEIADRLSVLAESVGARNAEASSSETTDAFIDWVQQLVYNVGIPPTLADLGVERTDLPRLARLTTRVQRLLQNHPGPRDETALTAILDAAWLGDRDRAVI